MTRYSGKWRHLVLEPAEMTPVQDSIDETPWAHPFLQTRNLSDFRSYSEQVWGHAKRHAEQHDAPLRCAFTDNMAQNMHVWSALVQRFGWPVTLFPHPLDGSAINTPEWEQFDGEYGDIQDGKGFLGSNGDVETLVPVERVPMDDGGFLGHARQFALGNRRPLLEFLRQHDDLRSETLLAFSGSYPYFRWAQRLHDFDAIYAASTPFAAYASGTGYCAFSVGGDLQYVCGRGDDLGIMMSLAFNGAKFILVSNPHTLGHARRLGFDNPVYLPYPVDDERYCPGPGTQRKAWEAEMGEGVFVLSVSRIDDSVKGQGKIFEAIIDACKRRPELRFVFLDWGTGAASLRQRIAASGLAERVRLLPAVGKRRLLDLYRSSDVLLDSFVFGYYGATVLEAAAVGLPVLMYIREAHYAPLYQGDTAPVLNCSTPREVYEALVNLAGNGSARQQHGERMRRWLIRNHGSQRTVPLLQSLLRLAADRVSLPPECRTPLLAPLSQDEVAYHERCLRDST